MQLDLNRIAYPMRSERIFARRGGFTMIELLVVVSVILILATLTIAALGGMIVSARTAATKASVEKLSGLVDERRRALGRHLDDFDRLVETSVGVELWNKRDPNGGSYMYYARRNMKLAKILLKKDSVREALPQRFADVPVNLTVAANGTRNWTFLRADGETDNGTESAEVLYYALTGEPIPAASIVTATGTVVTADANYRISITGITPLGTDAFTSGEVADTDGDKRLEFVDGWGRPLRFYRWPTRLLQPNGFDSTVPMNDYKHPLQADLLATGLPTDFDLQRDPDDPLGRTQNANWIGAVAFENSYHTVATFHTPLIVSAGADNVLGLYEPYDYSTATRGYLCNVIAAGAPDSLTDNITNLNVRAGGN